MKFKKKQKKENLETRQFRYFVWLLGKLPADEFIGIARVLRVPLFNETDQSPREFSDIFEGVLDEFLSLDKTQRHNLIWIMEAALAKDEENEFHADSSYKVLPIELMITSRATVSQKEE